MNFVLKKCNFSDVNKEKILNGEVILVKDEVGKIIPYYNPCRCYSIDILLKDILEITDSSVNLSNADNCIDLKEIGKRDYDEYIKKRVRFFLRKNVWLEGIIIK